MLFRSEVYHYEKHSTLDSDYLRQVLTLAVVVLFALNFSCNGLDKPVVFVLTGLTSLVPVSYTHLDVYKRQPSTYTCAVYSSALSLLPPVIAIVLALNTKEVSTSLLVGIATDVYKRQLRWCPSTSSAW